MKPKFCFFTDPVLLEEQQPDEAFGPLPALDSHDRFQCTDLHSAVAGAPVVAICDGQLRAVVDEAGTGLNLILKPDGQMPFDFPFVTYFLYKGVDRASLLAADMIVAENSAPDIELINILHEIWRANGNSGSPDKSVLGLDLGTGSDAADYADDEPIDRLFYGYPKERPPVHVTGGQRLARFGAQFGFEILVEQIGRQPPLKYARSTRTIMSASQAIAPSLNAAIAFLDRHDNREAVLGFVDPCAFWGSFFRAGLDASDASSAVAVPPGQIYATILCGTGGEQHAAFRNRNRAYLDIRNEHGQSMNYYRTATVGNDIRLGFEDQDPLTPLDYYQTGWPCCWMQGVTIPTLPDPGQMRVRFALPATDYSRPLSYVSVGHVIPSSGAALRPMTAQERFIDREPGSDPVYLLPGEIAVPMRPGTSPDFAASYQRIHHFKRPRPGADTTPPALAADPDNLAPVPTSWLDNILPLPGAPILAGSGSETVIKTYADVVLVPEGAAFATAAFVARPGFAQDASYVYLFLFPTARLLRKTSKKDPVLIPGPPSLQLAKDFFTDFLANSMGGSFSVEIINPGYSSLTPAGTMVRIVRGKPDEDDLIVVILKRIDYEPAVLAPDNSSRVLEGTGWLSVRLSDTPKGRSYCEGVAAYTRLTSPTAPAAGDKIVRTSLTPFSTLYGHADP
ncbi:MAG: hypothetical protein JWN66_3268 [Sphingomonas bacterium]|uniref:hypothetical protein n=1 Tax=Sphingomonas bacterium TaxID=1895847 RepID=UPI002614A408|nr:hypothetical protein [Sphingomonas bacterium]MDB5706152.1 hypothetical protein [Sphingomonas bacterium]